MYLTKTPGILKPLSADLIWDIPTEEKVLFLTFDDGPIPEVTLPILQILKEFQAKGTFFCVGENVERHPAVAKQITHEGHAIGNHLYKHEKGWETEQLAYLRSYVKCRALVGSRLFRPPYGRIKRQQVQALKKDCDIIMWDVLSGDFDPKCTGEKCVENVIKSAGKGSIVVFHDSLKAKEKVLLALPQVLAFYAKAGYRFESLNYALQRS